MATPTLHYFNIPGRGEVIRILFVHSGMPFNDHRISFEEWGQLKPTHFSEFDQLPMLEIDGLKLVQSLAILRYLGNKFGYLPSDPVLVYQIDSLLLLQEDFLSGAVPLFIKKDFEGLEKWFNENAPRFIGFLEARLSRNNEGTGWFVGDSVTIADILVFQWLWDAFIRPIMAKNAHFLDAAPKLKAWFNRMLASSPALKAYHETRDAVPQ